MNNRLRLCLLLLGCALCASAQKVTAVRFAKLWDGQKVIDHPLVLIEAGRICSVQGGKAAPPAGADVIDWSRYYGLPGMIDVHTHIIYYWDRQSGTLPRGQQRMAALTVL